MASIYHGRGAVLGLAEESTYGTAIAAGSISNFRPLISSDLTRTIEKVPRPTLRVGAAGAMRRKHYVQADNAGGSFEIEGTYESMGMLLKHIMGTHAAPSGSGPYTHVYTFADDVPTGLTLANVRGTGTTETFEGCRVNTATFACSAGGVMTLACDVIAETSANRASFGGTVAISATDSPILHSHAGQLSFNSVNYDLIDMSLVVNNALAVRQHLGSEVTAKPLRSDFQSVELTVTLEVEDALYQAFLDDTEGDVVLAFSPSGSTDTITFTVHNAYISSASDPVSDANVVRQTIVFVGQSDGSDEGLKIEVVNDNSSSTGN